jgi:hypothetical protein
MTRSAPRSSRRGAVLIVALLFAAGIAISLGSFLQLSTNASQLSYRSFWAGSAMNAAETGLEHGMWSVNKHLAGDASAWSGWGGATQAQRSFDLGLLSGGARSEVKVYVSRRDLVGSPFIVSRSIITPPKGPPTEKWIKVTLRKRSRHESGLVARNIIRFSGNNASVDSWDSDPDNDPSTPPVPYSAAVRRDNGSVGSVLIENPSIFTNNADIWGTVSTGGVDPTSGVGSNGSILGADSATKDKSSWVRINVDPDRVSTDFTADFDVEPTPAGGTTLGALSINGSAHLLAGSSSEDSPTVYRLPRISMSGNDNTVLRITGHVSIVLTETTGDTLSMTGNSSILIEEGASLRIYSAGDINIAGNGIANLNTQPKSLRIFGTALDTDNNGATTHQRIDIAGNGDLKAVVFAPNAVTNINGNGNVMGSVVSGNINVTGNAAFHYDESLARLDGGEPLGLDKWNELVSFADRQEFEARLSF